MTMTMTMNVADTRLRACCRPSTGDDDDDDDDCCRYSFEGVLQAIYGRDRGELECGEQHCIFSQASDVLEQLDVQHAEFYLDFIILCIFFVALRIGCYLVLRWRVKSQR